MTAANLRVYDSVEDSDIQPGSTVKVTALGEVNESFWVIVVRRSESGEWLGTVDNHLVYTQDHGLRVNDVLAFETRHVREISA